MELELTTCPDCGRPAEVVDRLPWGVDKPLEYVKTRCVTGPWFLTSVERSPLHGSEWTSS